MCDCEDFCFSYISFINIITVATFINKIYLFGLFIESDFTFILNKIVLVSRWWSTGDGSNIIVLVSGS